MWLETARPEPASAQTETKGRKSAASPVEFKSLKQLRKNTVDLTQGEVADRLRVSTQAVSRIENEADILLSTLRSYVKALGGELEMIIKLPDQPPFSLKSLQKITNT